MGKIVENEIQVSPKTFSSSTLNFVAKVNQRTDLTASSDWNRMNLRSVTDQSSLEEFLTTAQLADTDFTAGKSENRNSGKVSSFFLFLF